MRHTALFSLAAGMAALGLSAPAHAAKPITGAWYTDGKRAIVTIAPCGKTLCGKITRFIEKPRDGVTTDINNPDPKQRKRKLLGLPVLSSFTEDGDKWRGQIYDPESGKSYRSVVTLGKGGTLKVQGCIGPFCQTQVWTAVP
ncbi:MAG: DUF2147 domain-containing protein [Blastomonas sp.]